MKKKLKDFIERLDDVVQRLINDNDFITLESSNSVLDNRFDLYYELTCDGRDPFIVTFSHADGEFTCKVSYLNRFQFSVEREIVMRNDETFVERLPEFMLKSLRGYLAR